MCVVDLTGGESLGTTLAVESRWADALGIRFVTGLSRQLHVLPPAAPDPSAQ